MIKKGISRFTGSFLIVTILLMVINVVINRRLDINYPHVPMVIGALLMALAITLSITLFKLEKINAIIASLLGLLPLLTIPLILRRLYGLVIFRTSLVLLIAFGLCAIVYAIAVVITAKRYQKETSDLNELLK
ncbi:MAG TPA: hypothetical protein PK340_06120 [Bacilli bacterium]|mgnify:CR=1 FL=1|jgi:uncharacterized membrane protein HdeD (DUF308 family)|nr:hypothetical protein [Bacilli bacterium]